MNIEQFCVGVVIWIICMVVSGIACAFITLIDNKHDPLLGFIMVWAFTTIGLAGCITYIHYL